MGTFLGQCEILIHCVCYMMLPVTFTIPQFKTVTVVTLNSVIFSYKCLRILELESNEKNSRIQMQLQIFSTAADDVKPYFDVYLYIYNLLNL